MQRLATGGLTLAVLIFGVSAVAAARRPAQNVSPVYGVALPKGYRDWQLVSVAREAGKNNDIRAILGNGIAVKAFRQGKRPFPDGSVLVRLAWRFQSSPRNDSVFPAPQSFIAGDLINVQVSVKDSKRYAASGGWGYGQFENGAANQDPVLTQACFICHAKLKALDGKADLVFTDYSQ
ncbi:cytochrome P460 family protein [Sphingomonas sp. DG1-23]|uniref:cytochrome P460 family protein n=1 Tax=Sphingomonas sp. DG1-23 TaxID=3068316 RepID=UPI00273E9116|nr:cytochrome P460 family protein [Sphingomonas sp. DG1-23]MDP5280023.1 cytochrome P460 family protein [Sphingomonas sp. DG1-23]